MPKVLSSFPLRLLWLFVLLFYSSAALLSQTATPPIATYDGGTREVLESIFIPPTPRAPFSLTLETEWSRPLGNGGTYTVANKRRIMRDSTGRIYQERWTLVPKNGKMESLMTYIQIADPAEHTLYNCEMGSSKQCFLLPYGGSVTATYQPGIQATGPLPDGAGFHLHEDLGHNNVAGIDTIGYRETTTINPGVAGNDQPMITTREFWYSPLLGINVLSKFEDPRSGKQLFTAKDLSSSEPEARFFSLPEGSTVVDQRKLNPANSARR